MVNIRKLVMGGLTSLLVGLSACSKPELTEAEQFYNSFPVAVDGARKIDKHETSGAKHCLVHVRQAHYPLPKFSLLDIQKEEADEAKKHIRDRLSEASNVQGDIYCFLTDLINKGMINSVRGEGVTKSLSKIDCSYEITIRNSLFVTWGYATSQEMNDPHKYQKGVGAYFLLGSKGSITVNPADDETLSSDGFRRLRSAENGEQKLSVLNSLREPREDSILKLIYDSKEPYSVVVFGGEHYFENNMEEWNKKNPDDKFSLITVTPISYKGLQKK